MPAAGAQERAPRPVDQGGHVRGLGLDGERAGFDTPGIQQVRDEAPHVVGLGVDDAVERAHLRRGQVFGGAEQGGGRPLDGHERLPQLVAHQLQELRPQPLQLLERRQVLQGHHHRLDLAVAEPDRRGVDQHRDASPVGRGDHHLFGAHRFAATERLCDRELGQGHLAPIGATEGHRLQHTLGRVAGRAQRLGDPPRLAVDRHRLARFGVEDRDAHRRRLDQGLEVGPRPPLVAVGAGVGDRGCGLRGEQHQHLLVLRREPGTSLLPGKKEEADILTAMAHRGPQEGIRQHQVGGEAERLDIGGQGVDAKRCIEVAEVGEQSRAVRPGREPRRRIGREPRGDEVPNLAPFVNGGDDAVAGAGQRAGAVDDLAQHGADVEARVDAQDGCGQARGALLEGLGLRPGWFPFVQWIVLRRSGTAPSPADSTQPEKASATASREPDRGGENAPRCRQSALKPLNFSIVYIKNTLFG